MSKRNHEILIVDDIPKNLQIIGDILYSHGLGITVATTGKQAIEIAILKQPDLILLDIAMPEMDGYEVCKRLKTNGRTKNIPVVFLTARAYPQDIIKGFDVGGVDYVTKPFNSTELLARIKTHLELKTKTEELKKVNSELEERVADRTSRLNEANIQLRKANEGLTESNQQLSEANRKLSRLDKAKKDFLVLINHELRTPLNVIMGFSQILKQALKETQYSGFVKRINNSVNRLVELTESALLITTLNANSYKAELQGINLLPIINEIIGSLQNEIKKKELNIDIQFTPQNLQISSDEKLLYKCFTIILENTVKFSPEKDTIVIKGYSNKEGIIVEVLDNGKGFSEEVMAQMFDMFTIDKIEHHSKGFGLGLATAKLIMDTLEGKIEAFNREPKGACVKLIFKGNAAAEKN